MHSVPTTTTGCSPFSARRRRSELLIILPLLFFAGIYLLVRQQTIQHWDEQVILTVHNWRTPFLNSLFQIISNSGGVARGLILLPVVILFMWRGRRLEAGIYAGAALAGQLITWSLKYLVNRPRPNVIEELVLPTDPSFPSGHALGAAIVYGWLAIWVWQQGYRWAGVLLLIWVLLVAFSRVYLGAHHPSDVLASLSLAMPYLTIVFMLYRRQTRSEQ